MGTFDDRVKPASGGGSDTPDEIVTKLESLSGDSRLDATAVKNLPSGGMNSLTGDVTASGSGSVPATVVKVGGKVASTVATAVGTVEAATSIATPSTLVLRNPSGGALFERVTAGGFTSNDDAVNPKECATLGQVKTLVAEGGIAYKDPAKTAAFTAVTLATNWIGQVISGHTLAATDLVVLGGQTAGSANGVYRVNATTGFLERAPQWLVGVNCKNYVIWVTQGTFAGNMYIVQSSPAIIGTDILAFSLFYTGQAVDVDNVTIQNQSSVLSVKDSGITTGKLATTVLVRLLPSVSGDASQYLDGTGAYKTLVRGTTASSKILISDSTSGTAVQNSGVSIVASIGADDSTVPTSLATVTYANTKFGKTVSSEINGLTAKTSISDNDVFLIEEGTSWNKRKAKASDIKSYMSAGGGAPLANVIYVCQQSGNDSNSGYSITEAKKTIAAGITAAGSLTVQVCVLPGYYSENVTIANAIELVGINGSRNDIIHIGGSVSMSGTTAMASLKCDSIIHTGGHVEVHNVTCYSVSSTGTGSFIASECDFGHGGVAGTFSTTSTATINIDNCTLRTVTINNASANVNINNCSYVGQVTLTTGLLSINNSKVFTDLDGNNAITADAGTLSLANLELIDPDKTTAKINIAATAVYSMSNCIIDQNSSILGVSSPRISRSNDVYLKNINGDTAFTGLAVGLTPPVDSNNTRFATTQYVYSQGDRSNTPSMNGVGSAGSSTRFSLGDHVHPTDTTRVPGVINADGSLYVGATSGGVRGQTGGVFIGEGGNSSVAGSLGQTIIGYSANAVETAGEYNTIIGHKAACFRKANVVSDYSTIVGAFAGGSASSTATATGTYLTAYGAYSGAGLTSGDYNSLFGARSGSALTTGSGNSVFGRSALSATTTSSGNTVIGTLAAESASTFTNSVVIGIRAARSAAVATDCVIVGADAGASVNSPNNILIGSKSGGASANISGSDNIGIGYRSMEDITTGMGNAAFGSFSAGSVTTGNCNVALGFNSLKSATTGGYKIAIGYNALSNLTNQNVGNDIIAIGNGALTANGSSTSNLGSGSYIAIGAKSGSVWAGGSGIGIGDMTTISGSGVSIGYGSMNVAAFNGVVIGSSITQAGTGDVAVGYGAVINGDNSVAVGASAASQINGVSVGQGAGRAGATGNSQVAVGARSLSWITSSVGSVGVGYQSGYDVTSGNYGVAVGFQAGCGVSGNGNVGIGYLACKTNGAGTGVVAIGSQALSSAAEHIDIVAIGTNALKAYASINNGVIAIGPYAASALTGAGKESITIGYNAASMVTSGDISNTISIGSYTLLGVTTGSAIGNTIIGRNAASGRSSYLNCTLIGRNADTSAAGIANSTAIGYNAVVSVSNGVVVGDTGTSSFGVGITDPTCKCDHRGGMRVGVRSFTASVGSLTTAAMMNDYFVIIDSQGLANTGYDLSLAQLNGRIIIVQNIGTTTINVLYPTATLSGSSAITAGKNATYMYSSDNNKWFEIARTA